MFDFKQLVQHPTHNGGHTLDLVLTRGVETSDLGLSHLIPPLYLVTCSPRWWCCQATYSCHHITPATIAAMAGKLLLSLAPLSNYRSWIGSQITSTLPLSSDIDSASPLVLKKLTTKRPAPRFNEETCTLKAFSDQVRIIHVRQKKLNLPEIGCRFLQICF